MRKMPIFLAVLFLTVLPASATTYYVNPHPEAATSISIVAQQVITRETITAALADANAGDTIVVAAGICATRETFPLIVNKEAILIRGAGATIVSGESDKVVFSITAKNISLEAMVIKNGTQGVSVSNSGADLRHTTIMNCGAGVSVEGAGASANVTNSIIFSNSQVGLSATAGGALTSSYNDVFGNGTNYNGVTPGANDLSRHPALNDDFTLKPCSPAIDAGESGVDLGAISTTETRDKTIYVGAGLLRLDFTTISSACTAVLSGDTIRVSQGTYNQAKGETFPIEIPANVSLIGSGGLRKMVYSPGYVDGNHTRIEGSVKLNAGSTLESVAIEKIGAGNYGIVVSGAARATLKDLIVSGEGAAKSGILLSAEAATVRNVLVYGFTAAGEAGILSANGAIATLGNITLTKNENGLRARDNSQLTVSNSIIASNETFGIHASDAATVTVSFSDLWGNPSGDISAEGASTITAQSLTAMAVIFENPLFRVDTLDGHKKYDFRLKSVVSIPGSTINSPCIDSGIDMGAFGGTDWDELFVDPQSPGSYVQPSTPAKGLENKIIIVGQYKEGVAQPQWLIDAQAAYKASQAAGASGLSVFRVKPAQAPVSKNTIDICINLLNPAIVQASGASAQSVKAMIVEPGTTVRLTIFNLRGEQVLTRDVVVTSPIEKYEWNGVADLGGVIPNGIYTFLAVADGKIIGSGPMTVMNSP